MSLTTYICPRRCAEALEWYGAVLGAVEDGERFVDPDGRIGHAEILLGGTRLMLSDAYPDHGAVAPEEGVTATTFALHLEVPDADASVASAHAAGAGIERPVEDQFDGTRRGKILDPFGVRWMISTQVRVVSAAELAAAAAEFGAKGAG